MSKQKTTKANSADSLCLVGNVGGNELRLALSEGRYVLGSGPGADLRVQERSVSRSHAVIVVKSGCAWVEDLGSTNGTFVDGKRIERSEVSNAHELSLGSAHFIVERVDPNDLIMQVPLDIERPRSHQRDPSLAASTLDDSLASFLAWVILPEIIERSRRSDRLQELAAWACASISTHQGVAASEAQLVGSDGDASVLARYRAGREDTEPAAQQDSTQPTAVHKAEATLDVGQRLQLELHIDSADDSPRIQQLLDALAQTLSMHSKAIASTAAEAERSSSGEATPNCVEPPRPPSQVPAMRAVYQQARAVAPSHLGVLILGETGTGKELLARFLYQCSASAGTQGPFLAINCAAVANDLLEAELFGIEKGVATGVEARPGKFEEAHQGTLFLDEIGEMPERVQAAILRVLQEKQVQRIGSSRTRPCEVRVVSATNRDIAAHVEDGRFRRDLFYRIAGCTLELPPLRERRADVVNLAAHFAEREAHRLGKSLPGLSAAAVKALENYSWPGNVRQLRSEIARAVALASSGQLLGQDRLSSEVRAGSEGSATDLSSRVAAFERKEIEKALERHDQLAQAAADELRISRATLYRKLQRNPDQ